MRKPKTTELPALSTQRAAFLAMRAKALMNEILAIDDELDAHQPIAHECFTPDCGDLSEAAFQLQKLAEALFTTHDFLVVPAEAAK